MTDITTLSFVGDWRITVLSKDADWAQRVVAEGTQAGTNTLPGAPGASTQVFDSGSAPWSLRIEHRDDDGNWSRSVLQATSSVSGVRLEYIVRSEDNTTEGSDRDFNDLVVRLDKLGAVSQPVPPFAIRPETMQAMPEGIFEATLGRYFMAVRITNIFGLAWPVSARVGLSDRSRAWLHAGGVDVVDAWTPDEQSSVGQRVVNGRVAVGALLPGASRLIYFKVDVSRAQVRKHMVEVQVDSDAGAEDIALISPKAKAPIQVSRTTYDDATGTFVARCDVGTLTANIRHLVVDYGTFKRAMGRARRLHDGRDGGAGTCCDQSELERIRERLRAFLEGKEVDICAIWRDLSRCCAGDGGCHCEDWTKGCGPDLSFFAWPTVMDYTVAYRAPFAGQYGPIPYDDPWWKVLLAIVAIILSLAAAASAVADLANRADSVVIGTMTRSVLNALDARPSIPPGPNDPGSIDAAVAALNGSRTLSPDVFSFLDAQPGEFYTAMPIVGLGGHFDSPGTVLSNAQINALLQNLHDHPDDPAAKDALRVYKSGARSGIGIGALITNVIPVAPRLNHDGSSIFLLNQLTISQDEDTTDGLSCAGDSGSLWLQRGTNAIVALNHGGPVTDDGSSALACRIEDVMTQLGIRFA
ncbi:hypothetical protein [Luteibacter sp. SG786]|uniref:hypothetical protein n=1 Tax=Luteibacter sp. SG786 TaxID=2587130 RepID=UPI0014245B13|nr:hypothetical protein [Luteibacter sp. SG786]NII55220.1 hypothetical protein [Luteibacter sp. SG786]